MVPRSGVYVVCTVSLSALRLNGQWARGPRRCTSLRSSPEANEEEHEHGNWKIDHDVEARSINAVQIGDWQNQARSWTVGRAGRFPTRTQFNYARLWWPNQFCTTPSGASTPGNTMAGTEICGTCTGYTTTALTMTSGTPTGQRKTGIAGTTGARRVWCATWLFESIDAIQRRRERTTVTNRMTMALMLTTMRNAI
ncbi:hypothetical protein CERZMDRAFT_85634 [Cercospora zeae-maydis SCOH1-5]|uniref:Uncharacterized protein n=1 Tax=Cercospora zeae-maydis SCOH1-5 TaxID=717836 RepID=A0A6A6FCF0_9PEZI|nr:hypothetical protein CERZMDRAFT_85634 [Cercospora zeae-maydis SCOH1-5]